MKGAMTIVAMLLSLAFFIFDALFLVFSDIGPNGYGLYGLAGLYSGVITTIPKTYNLIEIVLVLFAMSAITALPLMLIYKSEKRALAFFLITITLTAVFTAVGRNLVDKANEFSAFSRRGMLRTQIMKLYGLGYATTKRHISYFSYVNPRHIEKAPRVFLDRQAYDLIAKDLYDSTGSTAVNSHQIPPTAYCVSLTVEKVGPYERIIGRRHALPTAELRPCPPGTA